MNSKLKEKKPYYLIISRKIIFWLVVLMLGIAIFLLFTRQDANKGRLIFTMVQLLGMLLVLRIPQFIKDKYHFQIPGFLLYTHLKSDHPEIFLLQCTEEPGALQFHVHHGRAHHDLPDNQLRLWHW